MLRAAVIIMLVLAAVGCSPSREIASRANGIAERAQDEITAWDRVERAHKDLAAEATAGRNRARANMTDAHAINKELTGVEDQTPWWASIIGWLAVAVVCVCIVVVLWQTGLGTAIRIAIGWLPKRKVQEADLAVAMLDDNRPEGAREFVAAKRAADPAFDAAFKQAKAQEDKGDK